MTNGDRTASPESKGHFAPCSNRDFDFFYQGLEQRMLLIQKCCRCGTLRNPPGPACAKCRSLEWEPVALRGTGVIFSYTVHFHPQLKGFAVPHPIVIVDMDEGIRLVGAMDGERKAPQIGLRVRAEFLHRGDVAGFRFRLEPHFKEPASASSRQHVTPLA